MAATINNTLVKIQTVTVGSGGASSIDFTSIPQTYTDLVIKLSCRTSRASAQGLYKITFNATSANYSGIILYSYSGTSVTSETNSAASGGSTYLIGEYIPAANATASVFSCDEIYIPNYTSSNYKSVSMDLIQENNAADGRQSMTAGLWSNTAAISSIKIESATASTNLAQYSTATLYGVTATPNTTKASGGIIYQDATYMYHVFPYSGTFTPSTSLSCDVLVVAGGGAGGSWASGGGGAGGVVYQSGRTTANNTNYTVTVGAGGAKNTGGIGQTGGSGSNSVFDTITANGGGGGGSISTAANSGGSGGGGGNSLAGASATQGNSGGGTGYGNAGGTGVGAGNYGAGGGGGAGAAGTAGSGGNGGAGGVGLTNSTINTLNAFGSATSTGELSGGNYYYAGGGGGGGQSGASGGLGGGGAGKSLNANADGGNGTANTGGGGGGVRDAYNPTSQSTISAFGGQGGSGLVIVRYAK